MWGLRGSNLSIIILLHTAATFSLIPLLYKSAEVDADAAVEGMARDNGLNLHPAQRLYEYPDPEIDASPDRAGGDAVGIGMGLCISETIGMGL